MALKQKLLQVTTAMWCWNPETDHVCVISWPDTKALSASYEMTAGACYAFVHQLTSAQRHRYVVGEALKLSTHYRCDALAVHTAFSTVREYRDFLSRYETVYEALWAPQDRSTRHERDRRRCEKATWSFLG
jgi:hypothetical protein